MKLISCVTPANLLAASMAANCFSPHTYFNRGRMPDSMGRPPVRCSNHSATATGFWKVKLTSVNVRILGSHFLRPNLGCHSSWSTLSESSISPDSGLNLLLEVFRLPWVMHLKSTVSSSCCYNEKADITYFCFVEGCCYVISLLRYKKR